MSSSTGKKGKIEKKIASLFFATIKKKANCALGAPYRPSQETKMTIKFPSRLCTGVL